MSDTATNPLLVTYSGHSLDFGTLPQASVVAMIRRGVSHLLGSEMASKVTAYFDPDNRDETTLADTPENRAAKKAEFQAEAVAKLTAGTIGVSTRGPAVDPVEKIERRLAREQVTAVLAKNQLAWPKKAEDVVKFSDGREFTGEQLIARRLAHAEFGPAIKAEAKKIMAEQAKKKAKIEAGAAQATTADL